MAVKVSLLATDQVVLAGLFNYLGVQEDLTVVGDDRLADADVLVVASDRLSTDVVALLRSSSARNRIPTVLIIADLSEEELLLAVRCRVVAVIPRAAVTADRLMQAVRVAAAGAGVIPPGLVGKLRGHFEQLQREASAKGRAAPGWTAREIQVLGLLAEGMDTGAIAEKLCYSERTIKYVTQTVIRRFSLRNRTHAVAYAVRAGAI
jgi:DNA-binding NarL/FixJ family response regulator